MILLILFVSIASALLWSEPSPICEMEFCPLLCHLYNFCTWRNCSPDTMMIFLNNDVDWCFVLTYLLTYPPERHYVSVDPPHTLTLTNATENVTIDCQGYGKPSPAVVWKKNGATIKKVPVFSERYSDQVVQVVDFAEPSQWNVTNRLYLRPAGVTYDESGNYTCQVLNRTAGANYSEEQTIEVLCRLPLVLWARSPPGSPPPFPLPSFRSSLRVSRVSGW